MAPITPVFTSFPNLQNKSVVITGGANGVGASLVRTLYRVGAHVTFGDIDEAASVSLIARLQAENPSSSGSLQAVRVDVRRYEDNLALFETAFAKHHRVDHAFSIAGVTEGQNWFESGLDMESVKIPPATGVLDINLLGALYFTRIAAVYLRQNRRSKDDDRSLVLLGSLASFKEQQGLFVYQASKHGVMGLYRSTRRFLYAVHGIRVNLVCPSLIDTGMSTRVLHIWEEKGIPINKAEQVADYIATLAAQSHDDVLGRDVTGLAVYVEGGKGWEMESELDALDAQWMGPEMSENCAKIIDALGMGDGWTTDRPKLA